MNRLGSDVPASLRPRNVQRTFNGTEDDRPSARSLAHHANRGPSSATPSPSNSSRLRPSSSDASNLPSQFARSRSSSRFLGVPGLSGSQPATSSSSPVGIWGSSWSSLRGLAADLIGTDTSRATSPGVSPLRKRKPFDSPQGRSTNDAPPQWGPAAPPPLSLASGTAEQRRAEVEAKKRERLLLANGHITADTSGHYKSRDSDEIGRGLLSQGQNGHREALVYLHKVQPEDTLAGISIKFNCSANVFRKANRLWPNDSIQVRKIVVLPVDTCGVKSRKIPEAELEAYSLVEQTGSNTPPVSRPLHTPLADSSIAQMTKGTPPSSIPSSPSISISLSTPGESPWRHDSWVQLDGFPEPVELARLSPRALGFFPRSRRRSQSFSDLETPTASLELPRSSFQSSSPRQPGRSRAGSNSYFPHLQGPGGVGTMSKNVLCPGPANDGLNKLFPNLEANVSPRSSPDPQTAFHGSSNGLETVGGALEGWVRKLASRASSGLQSPNPGGASGAGDLIELSEEAFDLGSESLEAEDAREFHRGRSEDALAATKLGEWGSEQERYLQERFPPRGRVVGDSSYKKRS